MGGKISRKFADTVARALEAVAPGGGEIFQHAQSDERIGVGEEHVLRRMAAEKFAKHRHQAAHDGRFGVAAKKTAPIAELAHQPDDRNAAAHAIRVDTIRSGKGGDALGAIDNHAESFLRIVDQTEIVDELLEFAGERHNGSVFNPDKVGKRPRNNDARGPVDRAKVKGVRRCSAFPPMNENVLVPLPGFALPEDFPWRVGFVGLVNDQLRRLRATGHFLPPRFFGYYFHAQTAVAVGGSWTVSLNPQPPIAMIPLLIERLTEGRYAISSTSRETVPDYMLVHDRRDGTCWLWSFEEGLRFIEAVEPVMAGQPGAHETEDQGLFGP